MRTYRQELLIGSDGLQGHSAGKRWVSTKRTACEPHLSLHMKHILSFLLSENLPNVSICRMSSGDDTLRSSGVRGIDFYSSIHKNWEGLISGSKAGLHVGVAPCLTPLPSLALQHETRPGQEWWGGPQVCTPHPSQPLGSAPHVQNHSFPRASRVLDL